MQDTYYKTSEVIEKLQISRNTLYNWFKAEKIPPVRRDRNGCRMFTDEDIEVIR